MVTYTRRNRARDKLRMHPQKRRRLALRNMPKLRRETFKYKDTTIQELRSKIQDAGSTNGNSLVIT